MLTEDVTVTEGVLFFLVLQGCHCWEWQSTASRLRAVEAKVEVEKGKVCGCC